MSTFTPANSTVIIPPPPPPGMNYIEVIRPSLNILILCGSWTSALVPLLIALFVFSNAKLRRTPIFIMNVVSVLLGLALGILDYYIEVSAIIAPLSPIGAAAFIIFTVGSTSIPLFVESILVVRVIAVYPPRLMSFASKMVVYLPLILLKTARVVNLLVFWSKFFPTVVHDTDAVVMGQKLRTWHTPIVIELFLQLFDNAFSSGLFLWRLRHSIFTSNRVDSGKGGRAGSYLSRIRSLFWIGVSNFVFPVFLAVAELIFAYQDPTAVNSWYIFIAKIYVAIAGVLLATVWTAGASAWLGNHAPAMSALSAPQFALPPLDGIKTNYFGRSGSSDHVESGVAMDITATGESARLELRSRSSPVEEVKAQTA